ncbi:MAG: 50S ribosomal protein L1 [Puniceicoccales bacterium]|jgi:large subunit ribosomal protein L1|nr:50S ribosomal protein L1 [Puniceicoccales bacterium]
MSRKQSKRYRAALTAAGDLAETHAVAAAIDLLVKLPIPKFDETVEISAHLGVDPRQSDQMVRGTVSLPNGSGKKIRVLVFTDNPKVALDAGADFAGLTDLIEKISGGWLDFDVAVATTPAMKDVRKVARILGPRNLMPNPKSGTVSDNIPQTVKEVRAGRIEFKMDKTANIAIVVGKRSFSAQHLAENIDAALAALVKAQPASFKGRFIKSITLSATMSPGIKIDTKPYSTVTADA